MKIKKSLRLISILMIVVLIISLTSCSSKSDSNTYTESTDATYSKPSTDKSDVLITPISPLPKSDGGWYSDKESGAISSTDVQIEAGQLTAMQIDDFENYKAFYDYCQLYDKDQNTGTYFEYYNDYYTSGKICPLQLVKVTIQNGETNLAGIKVVMNFNEKAIFKAITNSFGVAYLYMPLHVTTEVRSYQLVIGNNEKVITITEGQVNEDKYIDIKVQLEKETLKKDKLELMFVIDTTGSMGDELNYLKAEISSVIASLQKTLPNTEISLALLFYRDTSDIYVTKGFDFTTDLEAQYKNLNEQSAAGGGDWEEAVEVALTEAVRYNWSEEATTKLLFHVMDAPPHNTVANMEPFTAAITKAAELGIRIIPVASSGIAYSTEYLLRCEALYTGGTYTAITNHSGIGNTHLEPTTEDPQVIEYLNALMVRLIVENHTGTKLEKVSIND